MRIRVRPSRRRLDRITLNLASMIDVTFLLLFYFMYSTVLSPQEDHLSPTLQTRSESSSSAASDFQPQTVEVLMLQDAPVYRIGPRIIEQREELLAALQPLPKTVGVFIRVFDGVPVDFAVAAIQVTRDAGFEQVTYVPAE